MFAFLNSYKGNIDKKIIDEFKENFDLDDKAELNNFNIEVSDNIQNLDNKTLFNACKNKVQDEKLKKFFEKKQKMTFKKGKEDYMFLVEIKNKSKKPWPQGFIKFQLDKKSTIFCKNIVYPFYEIEDGDIAIFEFYFDAKCRPGEYECFFDVFTEEGQLNDTKLKLYLKITE